MLYLGCDQFAGGRNIGVLNVINDFNHKALNIEVDFSRRSERVIRRPEQIIGWRGKPSVIRCDNGPEHLGAAIVQWAAACGHQARNIQSGKPEQNAYVERFN
jgi:putative transposase